MNEHAVSSGVYLIKPNLRELGSLAGQDKVEPEGAVAMRYGVACGTAATLNPGTELCSKEDADWLYELIVKG